MAAPINNNLTPQLTNTQARADRADVRGDEASAQQGQAAQAKSDAVTLSRAAEVLNATPASRGEGAIASAEQASDMAQNLKSLFVEAPTQALAAQSGDTTGLGEILRVG